eukprot:257279_1
MRTDNLHHHPVPIEHVNHSHHIAHPSNKSIFGDFTCVLKGYPQIYSLEAMKHKVEHTHAINVPKEKKFACGVMLCAICLIVFLSVIYWVLIFTFHYDLQAGVIIIIEIAFILSTLSIGMCGFRWCSLNDVSPHVIWHRVAVTQCTPLKLIKFDMEHVDITYFEYAIGYGQHPDKLHEPIITLVKEHKICNARDLVKITKKDPDAKRNPSSHGAIYFHFKGEDTYLLNRWRFEFGKYHEPITSVFKICNRFNSIFHQHFDNKFRLPAAPFNSQYGPRTTSLQSKEDNIMSILDGFGKDKRIVSDDEDDMDDFYHDTHEDSLSRTLDDAIIHAIHPQLLGKHRRGGNASKKYVSIQHHGHHQT